MSNPFAPIGGVAPESPKPTWVTVVPVPADAPPAPASHPTLGKPTVRWCYLDANGLTLGFVFRFDAAGEKQFRPLTYCHSEGGGSPMWRWQSWPLKRPLYGLHELANRPSAPVLVTEGEKACDAARFLLPGWAVVTSPNGAESAGRADWRALKGRTVTVWPDADFAGAEYAKEVANEVADAGALSVAIASPPTDSNAGWDAADAINEGWDEAQATSFLATATPVEKAFNATEAKPQAPKRDLLINCTECCELWHDPSGLAYASIPVNGHWEHWPIRSRKFRMWLSGAFYDATGGSIGGQPLEDGIRIVEVRADRGPEYNTFTRVGERDGRLYLDLCHDDWRVVEITTSGWRIIGEPPLKLMRSSSMRAMSMPVAGGMIEELRGFLNVKGDDEFLLVVGWLLGAMRHRGPYPILTIQGEYGTGKSMFSRMLRSLIDPAAAPIRAAPTDERDLMVSAGNRWVLAYDNLSSVPVWLSDALCRLATGGGFATRKLFSDSDEVIFEATRPTILNGIETLTDRSDMADRAITIRLRVIPETERRTERELWAEFEEARPRIIGALLDAACASLRNIDSVKLDRLPRMADFAMWVAAAAPGLGWGSEEILRAYNGNRHNTSQDAIEADNVAVAIMNFVGADKPDGWEGTPTELLTELNSRTSEDIRKIRPWPTSPQKLGNRIDRIAPLLRGKGYTVERNRSTVRTIIIRPPLVA